MKKILTLNKAFLDIDVKGDGNCQIYALIHQIIHHPQANEIVYRLNKAEIFETSSQALNKIESSLKSSRSANRALKELTQGFRNIALYQLKTHYKTGTTKGKAGQILNISYKALRFKKQRNTIKSKKKFLGDTFKQLIADYLNIEIITLSNRAPRLTHITPHNDRASFEKKITQPLYLGYVNNIHYHSLLPAKKNMIPTFETLEKIIENEKNIKPTNKVRALHSTQKKILHIHLALKEGLKLTRNKRQKENQTKNNFIYNNSIIKGNRSHECQNEISTKILDVYKFAHQYAVQNHSSLNKEIVLHLYDARNSLTKIKNYFKEDKKRLPKNVILKFVVIEVKRKYSLSKIKPIQGAGEFNKEYKKFHGNMDKNFSEKVPAESQSNPSKPKQEEKKQISDLTTLKIQSNGMTEKVKNIIQNDETEKKYETEKKTPKINPFDHFNDALKQSFKQLLSERNRLNKIYAKKVSKSDSLVNKSIKKLSPRGQVLIKIQAISEFEKRIKNAESLEELKKIVMHPKKISKITENKNITTMSNKELISIITFRRKTGKFYSLFYAGIAFSHKKYLQFEKTFNKNIDLIELETNRPNASNSR